MGQHAACEVEQCVFHSHPYKQQKDNISFFKTVWSIEKYFNKHIYMYQRIHKQSMMGGGGNLVYIYLNTRATIIFINKANVKTEKEKKQVFLKFSTLHPS